MAQNPTGGGSSGQGADPSSQFKLERYKFILQEIHTLNENLHKYLTLFQALATAIIAGGISLFVSWEKLDIRPEVARAGMRALVCLFGLLALFVIVSIIAGIFSWRDYRNEEVRLLDEAIAPG